MAKITKICADSEANLEWPDAVPLALMGMKSQVNHMTHLTPHEMLTQRPMPVPFLRGPYKGPPLEQLERELEAYCEHLTKIHQVIFQQVKGATQPSNAEIPEILKQIGPGDWVCVKIFRRCWSEPRWSEPLKVILATPTAVKVEGSLVSSNSLYQS